MRSWAIAQLPARTSIMDRSSKPLQELNSSPELQSLRRSFTSCQSKCACRVVGYMRNKNGEKRIQAERPRVQGNPPALDRDPQRLIFGYATNPLAVAGTSSPRIASSGRWAVQQPRCKRALRACSYRTHSIRSQVPFSLASRWQAAALVPFSCTTAPLPRSAALTVAALAAMCSAFRLLACRCTALLGPCASPVHGSCPALLRVAVLCVVLIGG